jgi:hypothetical protein
VAGARRAIPRRIHGARVAITSTARSERRIAVRRPGVGIDASCASGDPARGPWRSTASSCQVPGTGMLGLPSIDAKELFGTRLAFDLLGRCDNVDQVADTLSDYFEMIREPEHAFLVAFAALKVIAKYVERLLARDS